MTLHQFAPIVPTLLTTLLAVGVSTWSLWRVKTYRARGRRAVERMLRSRGEALVALKVAPRSAMRPTAGFNAVVVFEVRASTADGLQRTYEWAYAPRVFPWQTEGLQRVAHGVWIPA